MLQQRVAGKCGTIGPEGLDAYLPGRVHFAAHITAPAANSVGTPHTDPSTAVVTPHRGHLNETSTTSPAMARSRARWAAGFCSCEQIVAQWYRSGAPVSMPQLCHSFATEPTQALALPRASRKATWRPFVHGGCLGLAGPACGSGLAWLSCGGGWCRVGRHNSSPRRDGTLRRRLRSDLGTFIISSRLRR
jgi:hypothetical protein